MNLELDQRQRAMLEEIGIRVWQPITKPHQPRPQDDLSVVVPVTSEAMAQASAVSDIARMDWAALEQAVPGGLGLGDRQASWMVVAEAEVLQGEVGDAGLLLDNMLKALGLNRHSAGPKGVYITNALIASVNQQAGDPGPDGQLSEQLLRRQVDLVQPRVIVALGRVAAQLLLSESLPEVAHMALGKLRGQLHRYQGVPVVVTYAPSSLLRSPQDKAKAWADLCLAQDALRNAR